MPTKVYHAWPRDRDHAFSDRLIDLDEARLVLVAHLATDDLEQAFAWTQHRDTSWDAQTDRVLALQPGPYPLLGDRTSPHPRSTAVGDVFETTPAGQRFLVATAEFVPLLPRLAPPLHWPQQPQERHQIGPYAWDVALVWRLIAQRSQRRQHSGQDALSSTTTSTVATAATALGSAQAPVPRPDGRDPLRLISRAILTQLGAIDLRRALTDVVDPRIPLLVAPAQAGRLAYTVQRQRASTGQPPLAPTGSNRAPASSAPTSGDEGPGLMSAVGALDPVDGALLTASSVVVDGRSRLAKALLEDWPSVPYFRLTLPEVALCCDAYAPCLSRSATPHPCGYPLIQTTLTLDTTQWTWHGDAALPLLWRCPQCGAPLEYT